MNEACVSKDNGINKLPKNIAACTRVIMAKYDRDFRRKVRAANTTLPGKRRTKSKVTLCLNASPRFSYALKRSLPRKLGNFTYLAYLDRLIQAAFWTL